MELNSDVISIKNCKICDGTFTSEGYLNQHVISIHPQEISYLRQLHRKIRLGSTNCRKCDKNFSNISNLNRHIKEVHKFPTVGNNTADLDPDVSRRRKASRVHRFSKPLKMYKCAMCELCSDRKTLLVHYQEKHVLQIEGDNLCFDTLADFFTWKEAYENQTNSFFVEAYNRSKPPYTYIGFYCHQSRTCLIRSKDHGSPKVKESIKTNHFCPASIKLRGVEMKYFVHIVKTHIGHIDNSNVNRSVQQSSAIIKSFDDVLDEIHDTLSDSKLKGFYLPTKEDLHNIQDSFRSSALRYSNDVISVESWINDMKSEGDAVLYYKAQGYAAEECPNLEKDDFILIIMTPAQSEMLKKYGHHSVCIEGSHGTSSVDFKLTTLLVLDDVGLEFPCCFLVSNRTDKDVLSIFFTYVKKQIGFEVQSNIFISDVDPAFYDAWLQTMAPPKSSLFCLWSVDQAWRKNLKSEIKSKEKQIEVYKRLRTILEEKDQTILNTMISQFYDDLIIDPATEEFADYFMDNFMSNTQFWSFCYREDVPITFKLHGRVHRTLEYIFSNSKRFDKSIYAILRLVRDKCLDYLVVTDEDKLNKKNLIIHSRHCVSLYLEENLVTRTSNGWQVPSKDKLDLHNIQKVKEHCDCQLQCRDCQTCVHQYICSCVDSSVRYNMCKHVHLLCRYLKSQSPSSSDKETSNHKSVTGESSAQRKRAFGKPPALTGIERKRQEVVKQLTELIGEVPDMSYQELVVVEKCIATIRPNVRALKTFRNPLADKKMKMSPNKSTAYQRRIINIKKE